MRKVDFISNINWRGKYWIEVNLIKESIITTSITLKWLLKTRGLIFTAINLPRRSSSSKQTYKSLGLRVISGNLSTLIF